MKKSELTITDLKEKAQKIWGKEELTLSQIITLMGVVYGDICRWERNAKKDRATHTGAELQKELGNLMFSLIRWCTALGYDPEECLQKAIENHKKHVKELLP